MSSAAPSSAPESAPEGSRTRSNYFSIQSPDSGWWQDTEGVWHSSLSVHNAEEAIVAKNLLYTIEPPELPPKPTTPAGRREYIEKMAVLPHGISQKGHGLNYYPPTVLGRWQQRRASADNIKRLRISEEIYRRNRSINGYGETADPIRTAAMARKVVREAAKRGKPKDFVEALREVDQKLKTRETEGGEKRSRATSSAKNLEQVKSSEESRARRRDAKRHVRLEKKDRKRIEKLNKRSTRRADGKTLVQRTARVLGID